MEFKTNDALTNKFATGIPDQKNAREDTVNNTSEIEKHKVKKLHPKHLLHWLMAYQVKNNYINISGQVAPFFKPIIALKPWDWDGHFEYNKRYKRSF